MKYVHLVSRNTQWTTVCGKSISQVDVCERDKIGRLEKVCPKCARQKPFATQNKHLIINKS